MKKATLLFSLILLFVFTSFAQQKPVIKGTVKDANTGETIIGAMVLISEGKGVNTDFDGNFRIEADSGNYNVTISYVGYISETQKVKVAASSLTLNILLESKTLEEVEIVSDVAKSRETPIAFSNISSLQIKEELGTRDIPMVLNSTAGAYATEQGGGSGDARVNIRGFDQRNVAVMVDGVPVNDMETGAVFWSNWDGLGDITRTMQVQRGLGASKLAIPSVGGTINILTKGIDEKMSASVKQEVTDYGLYKTSFGYNSGLMKGDWGFTAAGSKKTGNEWADGTYTDAWSYFGKIQKRFKTQLFSLSASGAPQSHGQRLDKLPIAVYDRKLAESLGVNTDSVYTYMGSHASSHYTNKGQGERGLQYNPNWGILNDKKYSDKINFFHKPQINFSHFWTPSEKLEVSTILYVSIGTGGGAAMKNTVGRDSVTGQSDIQSIYDSNTKSFSPQYSNTEHSSGNYLRSNYNNHVWYGILNSWNYRISKNLTALLGIDARYYKGSHYQGVYDLLGGDYAIDNVDANQVPYTQDKTASMKRVGDKVNFYNQNAVKWGGSFAQLEYSKDKWNAFITGSFSETGYQRIDYFKKKDLVLSDTLMEQAVGSTDTIVRNGVQYTNQSAEARYATTKQLWFPGYTVKSGLNYKITAHHSVYVNAGYLNLAPRMNAVFDNNNHKFLDIENQYVRAFEGGYGLKYRKTAANLSFYNTFWHNKPPQFTPSIVTPDGTFYYNINGLDALHRGLEFDFSLKPISKMDIEGLVSLGDWKTTSSTKVYITDDGGNILDTVKFSAKNVHVGDAAQTQFSLSARYFIIKNLYLKPRVTYFAKHYANFDPITLTENISASGVLISDNRDRESWKMPDYMLIDLFAGYDFNYRKIKIGINAGVTNLLNVAYISDAQNGANFDANTALVFMGPGRRITTGLKIGF